MLHELKVKGKTVVGVAVYDETNERFLVNNLLYSTAQECSDAISQSHPDYACGSSKEKGGTRLGSTIFNRTTGEHMPVPFTSAQNCADAVASITNGVTCVIASADGAARLIDLKNNGKSLHDNFYYRKDGTGLSSCLQAARSASKKYICVAAKDYSSNASRIYNRETKEFILQDYSSASTCRKDLELLREQGDLK